MGALPITVNQPFYLAFDFPLGLFNPPGNNLYADMYGWAKLNYDGTSLQLLDSAAETTGVGIFAGTQDAVPEPGTLGLLLASIGAIVARRRMRPRL